MKENEKVVTVTLIVVAVAAFAWALSWYGLSVAVVIIGAIAILNRHIVHCRFCGSWWTSAQRSYVEDAHNPAHGTIYNYHSCEQCYKMATSEHRGRKPKWWLQL